MFIDILVTMVIVLILNFGMDLGPHAPWILCGVGLGTFLITHWITSRISDSIADGTVGMGRGGRLTEDTPLGKWISLIIVIVCLGGVAFGIFWYIIYKPPVKEEPVSLMNGKYPLPKDLKIQGKKIVIEGDTSDYPVASNDKEVQRILEHALSLPTLEVKKIWAEHYYSVGMKYYTYAKENTPGWSPAACYAFAKNNFTISSRLPSDGTINVESQPALLDCIHSLQQPK